MSPWAMKARRSQTLQRAVEERSFKLIYLKVDPRLKALQLHPKVIDLARHVGLEKA